MSKRVRFSKMEDDAIWNYVHVDNTTESVKGKALWQHLENSELVPNRTWQSLKDRYLKHIMPSVKRFKGDPELWNDGRMTLNRVAKQLGLQIDPPPKKAKRGQDGANLSPSLEEEDGGLSLLAADSAGSIEDVFQISPSEGSASPLANLSDECDYATQAKGDILGAVNSDVDILVTEKTEKKPNASDQLEEVVVTAGAIRKIFRRFMTATPPIVQVIQVGSPLVTITDGEYHMEVELGKNQEVSAGNIIRLDSFITNKLEGVDRTLVTEFSVIQKTSMINVGASRHVSVATGYIGREGRQSTLKSSKKAVEPATELTHFEILPGNVKVDQDGVYYARMLRSDPIRGDEKIWVLYDEEAKQPKTEASKKGQQNVIFKYSLTQSTTYTSRLSKIQCLPKEQATSPNDELNVSEPANAQAPKPERILAVEINESGVDPTRVGTLLKCISKLAQKFPGISRAVLFHSLIIHNGRINEASEYLAGSNSTSPWEPPEDQKILMGETKISGRTLDEIALRKSFLNVK